MDNRLDFISNFKDDGLAKTEMTQCRFKFIEIDASLKAMANSTKDVAMLRCIALARTHVETALQYSIKALCLKWENKDAAQDAK